MDETTEVVARGGPQLSEPSADTPSSPSQKVLNLQGVADGGARLSSAVAQASFKMPEEVNLEFAQGVEDAHLPQIASEVLKVVNLNACQKLTDGGIAELVARSPNLTSFSIYWNLK
eukprot:jgi/Mesen1/4621/ME000237S03658